MTESQMFAPLSAEEARALAVLLEKEKTVPDSYPMSLNALLNGCNQRSSRDPVMNLSESQLLNAIDGLRERALVIETSGGRVMRYEHNLPRVLGIPSEAAALLAILMLRGPQTAAELRAHVERMVRFADTSSVEGYLNQMAERARGALVELLPRQPGAREQRWRHCLSAHADPGTADTAATAGHVQEGQGMHADEGRGAQVGGAESTQQLAQRVEALEAQVQHLLARVQSLESELGIPGPQEADGQPE